MRSILALLICVLLLSFSLSGKVTGKIVNRSIVVTLRTLGEYKQKIYASMYVNVDLKFISIQQGQPIVRWSLKLIADSINKIPAIQNSFNRKIALDNVSDNDYLFYQITYTSGKSVLVVEKSFYVLTENQSLKIPI